MFHKLINLLRLPSHFIFHYRMFYHEGGWGGFEDTRLTYPHYNFQWFRFITSLEAALDELDIYNR